MIGELLLSHRFTIFSLRVAHITIVTIIRVQKLFLLTLFHIMSMFSCKYSAKTPTYETQASTFNISICLLSVLNPYN